MKNYLTLLLIATPFALNMSLHDTDNPSASHILDADTDGEILIVTGYIGGIEVYDISTGQSLNHLSHFNLSGGGGGGGGGTKAICSKSVDRKMYSTSSNGVYITNLQNPSSPNVVGQIQGTSSYNLENLDILGDILAFTAHTDGVFFYDISDYDSPSFLSAVDTENAWAVALADGVAYIADGVRLLTIDISDPVSPSISSTVTLPNSSKDIMIDGSVLYVALGSSGVSAYDISSAIPAHIDTYNTSALANRIDVFNGKVAVSDWDDVEVLALNQDSLELVGYKNNGKRTMAIATHDNFIYSAEWNTVQVFEYGQVPGPDIDISTWELNYDYTDPGSDASLYLDIFNNGASYLDISSIYTTNSAFDVYGAVDGLEPGGVATLEVVYSATSANASGSLRIFSNDQDESQVVCETNGNIDGANVGSDAPDFTLGYLANGVGDFTLSENLGKVVVLAFFSPM